MQKSRSNQHGTRRREEGRRLDAKGGGSSTNCWRKVKEDGDREVRRLQETIQWEGLETEGGREMQVWTTRCLPEHSALEEPLFYP